MRIQHFFSLEHSDVASEWLGNCGLKLAMYWFAGTERFSQDGKNKPWNCGWSDRGRHGESGANY